MSLLALILAAVWRAPHGTARGGAPVPATRSPASADRTEIERSAPDSAAAPSGRVEAAPEPPDGCTALARWGRATLGYDALQCRADAGVFALRPSAQFDTHETPGAFARVALQGAAWLTEQGIAPATTRFVIPDRGGTPACLTLGGTAAVQWLRRSREPGIDPDLEWRRALGALRRTDCPPPDVS